MWDSPKKESNAGLHDKKIKKSLESEKRQKLFFGGGLGLGGGGLLKGVRRRRPGDNAETNNAEKISGFGPWAQKTATKVVKDSD